MTVHLMRIVYQASVFVRSFRSESLGHVVIVTNHRALSPNRYTRLVESLDEMGPDSRDVSLSVSKMGGGGGGLLGGNRRGDDKV